VNKEKEAFTGFLTDLHCSNWRPPRYLDIEAYEDELLRDSDDISTAAIDFPPYPNESDNSNLVWPVIYDHNVAKLCVPIQREICERDTIGGVLHLTIHIQDKSTIELDLLNNSEYDVLSLFDSKHSTVVRCQIALPIIGNMET
jgi:hypothetical protein